MQKRKPSESVVKEEWKLVDNPPPVAMVDGMAPITSGPVLALRKGGRKCVARYESWDTGLDEGETAEFHWVTDCSEGWRIDEDITHWQWLPEDPE